MTKYSRKMLKQIKTITSSTETILELSNGALEVREGYPRPKEHHIQLSADIVNQATGILDYLEQSEHVQILSRGRVTIFTVTHKGFQPYRVSFDRMKPNLFWSIVVPIAVSVITCIILERLV